MNILDHMGQFATPPSNCTQIPFWFLNGEVDGEEYCRQIDEMSTQGVYQAMPHPREGMDRREYLGPAYWDAIKQLAEHAYRRGFTLHLYDEYNWPSGSAGGKVTEDPDMCAIGLAMQSCEAEGPGVFNLGNFGKGFQGWGVPENVLSITVAGSEKDNNRLDPETLRQLSLPEVFEDPLPVEIPEGRWRVMVFYTVRTIHPSPLRTRNGGIIDYLNPAPTERFISLTHEQYREHVGAYFGNTIQSIFYDESALKACGAFPWTPGFDETFKQRHGYEITSWLPLLFLEGGRYSEKIRCDYWDTACHLFTKNHIGQIAEWCEKNNLYLTGHTYEEPGQWSQGGDIFRTLRHQHWVGMDSIGGYKAYHLLKPPAGVAHVTGRNTLLCEALGLIGGGRRWEASPRLIRQAYNQLAVVGVTHLVPHAFFQTVENPKVECPPSFFEQNYYWQYYAQINDLTSRQCWVNRQGTHVADIAVLYPVHSWWGDGVGGRGYGLPYAGRNMGNEPGSVDREAFQDIVDGLMHDQLDHDVIDAQAISDARFSEGSMVIANEVFSVLVVPPVTTMQTEILEKINEAVQQGVTVLFVRKWPSVSMENGRGDDNFLSVVASVREKAAFVDSVGEVPLAVRQSIFPDVEVCKGDPKAFEISHRCTEDADIYTVSNTSEKSQCIALGLRSAGTNISLWSPENGARYVLPGIYANGRTHTEFIAPPGTAWYVVISDSDQGGEEPPPYLKQYPARIERVKNDWTFVPAPSAENGSEANIPDEVHVDVPVFRTAPMTPSPGDTRNRGRWTPDEFWTSWYQPDFDDTDWELVQCGQGSRLLYSEQAGRAFRTEIPPGADAIKWPLPVQKEHVLYINAERIKTVSEHCTSSEGWLEFPQVTAGGILALECASMAPDFGITAPFTFRCKPVKIPLQSWTALGLWWYSGTSLYQTSLDLPDLSDQRVYLNLGDVRECVEIRVNGQLVDSRIWPPYRTDITDVVSSGSNDVTLTVSNLLANQFVWDRPGSRGEGSILDAGVLGPVTIEHYDV